MTTITGTFRDSKGIPINGFLRVRLDYRVLSNDSSDVYLPIAATVPLTSGAFTVDLEPSDLAKVTYLFEVVQVVPANGLEPSFETVIEAFRAKIPLSPTPINVTVLMDNTGITQDALDAAQVSIVRRLYNSEDFWTRLQQEVFVHRGTWTPITLYRRGEVVDFQGSSYLYINDIARNQQQPLILDGSTVTLNATYWRLLAAKGDVGAGITGNSSPYNAVAWDGQTDAPSRDAVRDIVETLATKTELATKVSANNANLSGLTLSSEPLLTDRSSAAVTSNWVQLIVDEVRKAIIPVGLIAVWGASAAPARWLLLDGRLLNRTTYAALFTIYGTAFNTGGEDVNSFRLPDARGRMIAGLDTMSALMGAANRITVAGGSVLGGRFGSEAVALTVPQLPSHSFNVTVGVRHSDGFTAPNLEFVDSPLSNTTTNPPADGVTGGRSRLPANVSSVGNNQAHPNLPPAIALNYIVYAGV